MKIFKIKIHFTDGTSNTINKAAKNDEDARKLAVKADRALYDGYAKRDIPKISYCEIELLAEASD